MSRLNAYEERLNRRAATTETTAYNVQQDTTSTTNNNGDDKKKKKKKNGDLKKKVQCFEYGKKGYTTRDYSHKKDDGQDGGNNKKEAYYSYVDASVTDGSWIVDSAASCHMTPYREWFVDYEPYIVPVNVANDYQVPSANHCTILIRALVESEWSNLRLVNLLHVLSFDRNLFSTSKIVERGCKMISDAKTITFEMNGCVVLAVVKRAAAFVLLIETHNSELCRAVREGLLRNWYEDILTSTRFE